jgi:hypothetical protein
LASAVHAERHGGVVQAKQQRFEHRESGAGSEGHRVDCLNDVAAAEQAACSCWAVLDRTNHNESAAWLLDLQPDAYAADVKQRAKAIHPVTNNVGRGDREVNCIWQAVFTFDSYVEDAMLGATDSRGFQGSSIGCGAAWKVKLIK